jgi:hypothetical protein
MLDSQTWWQVFRGAQAVSLRAGFGHRHPHFYSDCVFCECCNLIHAAALDFLALHERTRL